MNDKKIEFLYNSISDIQSTIRAIDVKAGATIALLVAPLTQLTFLKSSFVSFYNSFCGYKSFFVCYLILLMTTFWLLSIFSALYVFMSLNNPAKIFSELSQKRGTFYNGGDFNFTVSNIFRKPNMNYGLELDKIVQTLPENNQDLIEELTFEKVKVSFIRDLKIYRLNFSLNCLFIWLTLALILICIGLFI